MVKVRITIFEVSSDVYCVIFTSALWKFGWKEHRCLCKIRNINHLSQRLSKKCSDCGKMTINLSFAPRWGYISFKLNFHNEICAIADENFLATNVINESWYCKNQPFHSFRLLTAQDFSLTEGLASITFTALALNQRSTMFTSHFSCSKNGTRSCPCTRSAFGITFAPLTPLRKQTINHCEKCE